MWSGWKVGCGLAAGAWLSAAATAGAETWQQYRGDAAHTGAWGGTVTPATMYQQWAAPAGSLGLGLAGFNADTQAAVSADGSMVFAVANAADGSNTARLVALNTATGSVAWSLGVNNYAGYQSLGSPVYDNGYVYFAGSQASGSTARVYKVNAATGSTADGGWESTAINRTLVNATPTIAGGQLYLSNYGGFSARANQYALRLSDGGLAWSNTDGGSGQGAMAYDPVRHLVYQTVNLDVNGDGSVMEQHLRAYDAATGAVAWTSSWMPSYDASQLAIAYKNDRIYFQTYNFYGNGEMHIADAANNGALLQTITQNAAGDGAITVSPTGNLVATHTKYDLTDYSTTDNTQGYLAADGYTAPWTSLLGGGYSGGSAWADHYVFLGSDATGLMTIVDELTGEAVRALPGGGMAAFGNDQLFTIGADGTLYAYSTIPEPTSLGLLAVGGLLLLRRRG